MSQIKYPGTYRGIKVDAGIKKSSGGHIQLVAQLIATEQFDFETGEWVPDWQQYDEQYGSEITAYLMLFSKDTSKDAFATAKQLQKAWGWDGSSLAELEKLEPEAFQFRVVEEEYKGKKQLKVAWIDAYDATPGGTIQKLDESEIKKLDAQYANVLRKLSGGPKPKSVPKGEKPARPGVPGQPAAPTPAPEPESEQAETPAEQPEKPQKSALSPAAQKKYDDAKKRGKAAEAKVAAAAKAKKTKTPPAPPAPPAPPKSEPPAEPEPEVPETPATTVAESLGLPATCTAEEAWASCFKNKGKLSDVQIGEIWVKVTEDLGGTDAIDDWAAVRDIVIEKVG